MAPALAELRQAASEKSPEGICAAYEALRNVAQGMRIGDLLCIAGDAIKQNAGALIVSAYSHRHCFMCLGGTVSCDHCHGEGEVDTDRTCPRCDGIGLVSCGFCGGTGWSDRDTVPREMVSAVIARQLTRARADLNHLSRMAATLTPQKIFLFDMDHRQKLATWMIRLRARLLDLADTGEVDDEQEARLDVIAGKIDACLDILRGG